MGMDSEEKEELRCSSSSSPSSHSHSLSDSSDFDSSDDGGTHSIINLNNFAPYVVLFYNFAGPSMLLVCALLRHTIFVAGYMMLFCFLCRALGAGWSQA